MIWHDASNCRQPLLWVNFIVSSDTLGDVVLTMLFHEINGLIKPVASANHLFTDVEQRKSKRRRGKNIMRNGRNQKLLAIGYTDEH